MGGRGSRSTTAQYQVLTSNVVIQPNQAAAQAANNSAFSATDNQGFHDLYNGRAYFQKQNLTIDQQIATINYLSDTPERGSLYSMSQNMNYALANGQKLTANQQWVANQLDGAMHNLGYNMNLTRYDHETFANNLLKKVGINKTYDQMTESELKQALVGTKFGQDQFLSASYNNFANAPASTKRVFESRVTKINYKASAGAQGYMPGNGPGGAIGEMVLGRSKGQNNQTVLDVKLTNQMVRKKGTQSYSARRIEFTIGFD